MLRVRADRGWSGSLVSLPSRRHRTGTWLCSQMAYSWSPQVRWRHRPNGATHWIDLSCRPATRQRIATRPVTRDLWPLTSREHATIHGSPDCKPRAARARRPVSAMELIVTKLHCAKKLFFRYPHSKVTSEVDSSCQISRDSHDSVL